MIQYVLYNTSKCGQNLAQLDQWGDMAYNVYNPQHVTVIQSTVKCQNYDGSAESHMACDH